MDLLQNLGLGFSVALTFQNIAYCFAGVLLGTLVGVLPGVGSLATIAMLLPLTFGLPPVSAIIMLAGIYYGSEYGGSTTSILLNLPGEGSSVVTCIDGHQMARQGRAGTALAIAAIGSFFAGTVGTFIVAIFAPLLAEVALQFGAPEYFSLVVMALTCAAAIGSGSVIKSLAMVTLGLLLGIVGTDVNTGVWRFTFDLWALADGISIAVVAMAVFGLTEVIRNLGDNQIPPSILQKKITGLMPRLADLKQAAMPILRGTALGSFFGPLPGLGGTVSAFASYMVEKRVAKDPSRFGKGAIEGVAGPEAANNACSQTTFIPMLTLGIPNSGSMALMLAALTLHGIQPGPQVMTAHSDLFWGLIASMWIGNLMLIVLNLPLIGIWVRLIQIPYRFLFPIIMTLMGIGIYSLNALPSDVLLLAFFGFVGYLFVRFRCSFAPLILGVVLGPMMEESLRRALLISRGDVSVFFTRPISLAFMTMTVVLLVLFLLPVVRGMRGRTLAGATEG